MDLGEHSQSAILPRRPEAGDAATGEPATVLCNQENPTAALQVHVAQNVLLNAVLLLRVEFVLLQQLHSQQFSSHFGEVEAPFLLTMLDGQNS